MKSSGKDKGGKGGTSMCGMAPSAQKASVRSIPSKCSTHKNPEMSPVGKKAMTGGKIK